VGEEAEDIYCKASGRSSILNLDWYFSFNLFRFGRILQGIAKRNKEGTAASAKAVEAAKGSGPIAQAAWSYAQKAGAS
jgi:aminoglycoside phosphotransferase (APT) family kinase protein